MPIMTRLLSLTSLLLASSLTWAADSTPPQAPMPMTEQGQMHGQMQGKMHEHMQQRMKAMDTNSDGNISKAEFMANAEKHFQKMDANGDGQVSAQERSQMQQQMMQRKGQAGGKNPQQNSDESRP
jgi:Ca2+-binding EF-hand superfamily protein